MGGIADYHFIRALSSGGLSFMQTIMLYQGASLSSLITGFLTPFCGFHCWLISKNMTTLECCEQWSKGTSWKSPYDQGMLRNIQSVLGDRWNLWPLPVAAPTSDGVFFKVNCKTTLADADVVHTEAGASDQHITERSRCQYCSRSSRDLCFGCGYSCAFNELWQDACSSVASIWRFYGAPP